MLADPQKTATFLPRRRRAVLRLLVALALLALACVSAVAGSGAGRVLGIVAAVVAGLGALLLLAGVLAQRRPLLVLEPAGLTYRGLPRVPWSEVVEMRAIGVNRRPVLLVRLRDEDAVLARASGPWRALAEANRRATGALVVLAPAELGLTIEQLAAQVEGRRQVFGQ